MKRLSQLLLIGFFLFTNFFLGSCNEERLVSNTELSIPDGYINYFVEELFVGEESTEVKVVFQINRDWSMNIIYDDDKSPWCRTSPSSGEAGLHKVTLQIDSNESESTRSAEVQLIVDMKKFAGIVVSQKSNSLVTDSNRVVYDDIINSTVDSVYSTLGVLQCLRELSDRYVVLGEVRGDMAMINENTKTSLYNLANFNFDDDNEYLNVRDYYAVINNCNYALAKMDTTLATNNQRVLIEEYAALQGIRAWTYLQLAINYGEVPYYIYPVITEADADRAYAEGKKDIKTIAEDLALQLIPYLDYELPAFEDMADGVPILRLVLAELYLWAGDYEKAVNCYEDYFMRNKKQSYKVGTTNPLMLSGYYSLGGNLMTVKNYEPTKNTFDVVEAVGSELYYDAIGKENLAKIDAFEVKDLFEHSANNTHLSPSNSWKTLSVNQQLYKYEEETEGKSANFYYITSSVGDLRSEPYFSSAEGEYSKLMSSKINIHRRSIGYLRWAEALNALAKQRYDADPDSPEARLLATNAFYLLKDASEVFFPQGSAIRKKFFERFEKEIREEFIGVHARGCPDVAYDTKYYILDLATKNEANPSDYTFNDTISYIDNLIIDELALESTLEGNRFGDLIRFAERRGEPDFLAKRVASRKGKDHFDAALYDKLIDKNNWHLPFK